MIDKFEFNDLSLNFRILTYVAKVRNDLLFANPKSVVRSFHNFFLFVTSVPSFIEGRAIPFQISPLPSSSPHTLTTRRKRNLPLQRTRNFINSKLQTSLSTFFWLTSVNAFDVNAQLKTMTKGGGSITFLHVITLVEKWKNFEYFLINFFYFRGELMSFGNPNLQLEIEALNWSSHVLALHEWIKFRACFSTDIFRFNEFGNFFFSKVKNTFKVVFFFSDLAFQRSNHFYFTKKFWPTIGIIDSSSHPWTFLFALPVFMNSTSLQLFGLRFVLRQKKLNSMLIFNQMFHEWRQWKCNFQRQLQ